MFPGKFLVIEGDDLFIGQGLQGLLFRRDGRCGIILTGQTHAHIVHGVVGIVGVLVGEGQPSGIQLEGIGALTDDLLGLFQKRLHHLLFFPIHRGGVIEKLDIRCDVPILPLVSIAPHQERILIDFDGHLGKGDAFHLGAPGFQLFFQAVLDVLGGTFIEQSVDLIVIGLTPFFRKALQRFHPLRCSRKSGEGGDFIFLVVFSVCLFLLHFFFLFIGSLFFFLLAAAWGQKEQKTKKAKKPCVFFHHQTLLCSHCCKLTENGALCYHNITTKRRGQEK